MLVIRLQRTGRKGSAQFRIVVQDKRRTPKSGKVVQLLGNYDPHTKELKLDNEKAELFLKNGAQPSKRVTSLLLQAKVKLPKWVIKKAPLKKKQIKFPEKRRSTRPAEAKEALVDEVKPVESEQPAVVEEVPVTEDKAAEVEQSQAVVKKEESTPAEE